MKRKRNNNIFKLFKKLEKEIPKKRKRKLNKKGHNPRKKVKYEIPKVLEKSYDKIPIRQNKFDVPRKLKKNKRFIIQHKIKNAIENIDGLMFNGRVHNYVHGEKLKKVKELGFTSGLCQMSVFNPIKGNLGKEYKGFHLLIKITKDLYPLTELRVLSNFYRNGYAIGICNNSKDGIKLIKYYFEGKHKQMNKLAFKGKVKLEDILKYKTIYKKFTKLSKDRYKEYKIHSGLS